MTQMSHLLRVGRLNLGWDRTTAGLINACREVDLLSGAERARQHVLVLQHRGERSEKRKPFGSRTLASIVRRRVVSAGRLGVALFA